MTTTDIKTNSLQDNSVWIIDDDIPIELAEHERDDILSGERPIDRGTLVALLQNEEWLDDPVKRLVEELVDLAGNVTAFINPATAVDQLKKGIPIPDAIVYDLGIRVISKEDSIDYLTRILQLCISVVQVYTQESIDVAERDLSIIPSILLPRLGEPKNKNETKAVELAKVIAERIENSLSANLAGEVRRITSAAVESVLIKIDSLPIEAAVRLLAGKKNDPRELDFVKVIAVKVGEELGQNSELRESISTYADKKGISETGIRSFVDNLVSLITSHVQEFIQQSSNFIKIFRQVWNTLRNEKSVEISKDSEEIIKEFESFRLYTKPTDNYVRTGDIIIVTDDNQDAYYYYLVITPQCDLERFWSKTRGSLTLIRMQSLEKNQGISRVKSYGHSGKLVGESIIARETLFLPSIPIEEDKHTDFAIFIYEIETKDFESPDLVNAGRKNKKFGVPLAYTELKSINRVCKISDPYLSGILDVVRNRLFRIGTPELPEEEISRLNSLFK